MYKFRDNIPCSHIVKPSNPERGRHDMYRNKDIPVIFIHLFEALKYRELLLIVGVISIITITSTTTRQGTVRGQADRLHNVEPPQIMTQLMHTRITIRKFRPQQQYPEPPAPAAATQASEHNRRHPPIYFTLYTKQPIS